jgi:hypothetical protein
MAHPVYLSRSHETNKRKHFSRTIHGLTREAQIRARRSAEALFSVPITCGHKAAVSIAGNFTFFLDSIVLVLYTFAL